MTARKSTIRSEEVTKYLMQQVGNGFGSSGDSVTIEIPANWKITFSAVNPSSATTRGDSWCVRVYEMPGSKLRAVYTNVVSIRDLSIPMARQVRTEMGNSNWVRDSEGNFKEEKEVKVRHELREENL